jgi:hypothetical protein
MQWGLAQQNSKAPAVPQVLYDCVVARKTPMPFCSGLPVINPFVFLFPVRLPDF